MQDRARRDGRAGARHVRRLKNLIARIEPGLVSEHLCWSMAHGRHLNDLLPLPYTEEAPGVVCAKVIEAQNFLGCRILLESVSSYLQCAHSTIDEWDLLAEIARRRGCGMLLDINNIYVSACNHGFDARRYLRAIPPQAVAEIHLAGFDRRDGLLIDTHGTRVCNEVWALHREAIGRFGPPPTLIEWDTDIPHLAVLLEEAVAADRLAGECRAVAA